MVLLCGAPLDRLLTMTAIESRIWPQNCLKMTGIWRKKLDLRSSFAVAVQVTLMENKWASKEQAILNERPEKKTEKKAVA